MIDKNEALFVVRLPFGQKAVPYREIPEMIALALPPARQEESSEAKELHVHLLAIDWEGPLLDAVRAGELEVLNPFTHRRLAPPFAGRLFDSSVVTVRALRGFVERRNGCLELGETPEPPPAPVLAESAPDGVEPATPNWKMQIQAEATALCLRLRKAGASPTKNSILDSMAKWCRDNNVMTDGKIFPSANYLRTHVLGGKHWELPN